ncbi:MAG: single-stranded DNA-binding protein [Buchananella hordeovulneris]|nr:single-stranded DNA-binding protein [Buchananella hordeovulneris]
MANPLEITVLGYAATHASLYRAEGKPDVAEFRIAATPRYRAADGWRDLDTEFITVKAWRELAQDVASSVRKGIPLMVIGRLATERWERNGTTHMSVVIHATSVGVEVRRGVVTYARVVDQSQRPTAPSLQSVPAGQGTGDDVAAGAASATPGSAASGENQQALAAAGAGTGLADGLTPGEAVDPATGEITPAGSSDEENVGNVTTLDPAGAGSTTGQETPAKDEFAEADLRFELKSA